MTPAWLSSARRLFSEARNTDVPQSLEESGSSGVLPVSLPSETGHIERGTQLIPIRSIVKAKRHADFCVLASRNVLQSTFAARYDMQHAET